MIMLKRVRIWYVKGEIEHLKKEAKVIENSINNNSKSTNQIKKLWVRLNKWDLKGVKKAIDSNEKKLKQLEQTI